MFKNYCECLILLTELTKVFTSRDHVPSFYKALSLRGALIYWCSLLQDACSLLAVHNSQLLRRVCLMALPPAPSLATTDILPPALSSLTWSSPAPQYTTANARVTSRGRYVSPPSSSRPWSLTPCPLVVDLSRRLAAMVPLLRDRTAQLEWSLSFHKNMLFGMSLITNMVCAHIAHGE